MNAVEPVLHAAQVVGAGLIAGALLVVTAAVIPSMRGMTLRPTSACTRTSIGTSIAICRGSARGRLP